MATQTIENAGDSSGVMAAAVLEGGVGTSNRTIIHDDRGKFAPGNCANPNGRPKSKLISEAFRRILDDKGADEIAATVYKDAVSAAKGSDRHAAAEMIRDTIEGKPMQSMRIEGSIDVNLAQSLATLAAQINIAVIQAPQIDNTHAAAKELTREIK